MGESGDGITRRLGVIRRQTGDCDPAGAVKAAALPNDAPHLSFIWHLYLIEYWTKWILGLRIKIEILNSLPTTLHFQHCIAGIHTWFITFVCLVYYIFCLL